MIYFCAQKNRRALVLQNPTLNGIDYLEVAGVSGCGQQLAVTLLKDARSVVLTPENIMLTGGAPVSVVSVLPGTSDAPFVLTVNLNQSGDFSTYQLQFVAAAGITDPPDGFDPQLSTVSFSFKAGCPTPADCLPDNCCPSTPLAAPDINYLAKDYGGFRQVMLDRLSVLLPSWTETHAADLGVAMVETLAYAADHLSYQQDAVSTEAYLGTARSRISLRRHAKLVDYQIGEGCNACTWVALTTTEDDIFVPAGTTFYVLQPGVPVAVRWNDFAVQQLAQSTQPIFASKQDTTLFLEQNEMNFYAWGDADCCLPPGATEATLVCHLTTLNAGDVLLFEEVLGPDTGDAADANPANRWVVLLTSVTITDYKGRPLVDPLNGEPITRITWSAGDALPFPLCISSTTDTAHQSKPVYGVTVARGNILPADHGTWINSELLVEVPPAPPAPVAGGGCNCGANATVTAPLPRYYPELAQSTLTFSPKFYGFSPIPNGLAAASAFLAPDASQATPQISLVSGDNALWLPLPDLLSSDDTDNVFVVEVERNGSAFLRFGDNQYGRAPQAGLSFSATYRVGNGSAGNIGRDWLGACCSWAQLCFRAGDHQRGAQPARRRWWCRPGKHESHCSVRALQLPESASLRYRGRLWRRGGAIEYGPRSTWHPSLDRQLVHRFCLDSPVRQHQHQSDQRRYQPAQPAAHGRNGSRGGRREDRRAAYRDGDLCRSGALPGRGVRRVARRFRNRQPLQRAERTAQRGKLQLWRDRLYQPADRRRPGGGRRAISHHNCFRSHGCFPRRHRRGGARLSHHGAAGDPALR